MFSRAQRSGRRRSAAVNVERLEGRRLFCLDIQGLPDVAGPQADVAATGAPITSEWRFDLFNNAATPDVIPAGTAAGNVVRAEAEAGARAVAEPVVAAAEPVALRAAADTYVRDGSTYAGANFGNATQLQVKRGNIGWNREAYLRFDLSAIPSVTSATLRLFGRLDNTEAPSAGFTIVNSADTTWSETGTTWNTKLTGGTTVHAAGTVVGRTGQWYELDLTGFIAAESAAGRHVVTLVVRAAATSPSNILFDSDEAANAPQLVVSSDDETPPPPPPATTEPVTLRSPADTYVRDGSSYAGTNFGDATQLQVKKGNVGWNREAYLRFDLSSVPSVQTATLRLFGRLDNTQAASAGFTVLNSADTAWSETGTTWNSRLMPGTAVHASGTVTGRTGQWYEVDLSGFVRDEVAAGRQAVTLVIRPAAASPSTILFDSDEAANAPQLVVWPPSDDPAVTGLMLMDADTDEPLGPLTSGMTIDYASLPTRRLSVRADVAGIVGSVRFGLDSDPAFHTENTAPYAILGHVAGDLNPWTPAAGAHTLTVTAFGEDDGGGVAGTPRVVSFTVVDNTGGTPVEPEEGLFAWAPAENSPVARLEAQGVTVDGKLYVFGGYTSSALQATRRSDVYNLATNSWQRIADLPEAITHAGVAADGRDIYLAGGVTGSYPGPDTNKVWRYNIDDNRYYAVASLPGGRGAGAMARVGRSLHFFGGADWPSNEGSIIRDFGDHWVLDLDDPGAWVAKAAMPNPRNHVAGVTLGGKVYAIGGQHLSNDTTGNQTSVHRYDPATDTWKSLASLPKPLSHTANSTFVRNGRIVVMAGLTQNSAASNSGYQYDPASNTWAALPNAPVAAESPVAAYVDGKIIFTGGSGDTGGPRVQTYVGVLDNRWAGGKSAPVALGEVAAGIIGNKLYLVGEGSSQTFAYTIATGSWTSGLRARPHVGDHHAAEVINGKLYLFGGFNGSSSGKVQIYNPATNSWGLGASMPFSAGSASSAVIGGKVYVAGGIVNFQPNVGGQTTNQAAVYDPATNTWRSIASMPRGVNHAAASTDGQKLYVFGGRDGSGGVLNGFDTVQVYDPVTNTWRSSDAAGSNIAPLPRARGGTGRAVFADGEFYVMGGETKDGAGATPDRVYSRVDVYNPAANAWRAAAAMPTPRHGIFPVLDAGRIYVVAGGTRAGFSRSTALEILDVT